MAKPTSTQTATLFGRCDDCPCSHSTFGICLLTLLLQLSNKRRVVVSKFSGKMFVNVREYYEDKSGEMKPGKKVNTHPPRNW